MINWTLGSNYKGSRLLKLQGKKLSLFLEMKSFFTSLITNKWCYMLISDKRWSVQKLIFNKEPSSTLIYSQNSLTPGHFEAPNGKDIQKMRRLNVNLNGIVLCLMERIFTKHDGCHIQKTFLGYRRLSCMCKGYFWKWRNRKISIARVTWHLDAPPNGMLEFFFYTAGVYCMYLVYIIVCHI